MRHSQALSFLMALLLGCGASSSREGNETSTVVGEPGRVPVETPFRGGDQADDSDRAQAPWGVPFGINNAFASSRDSTYVYLRDLGIEWISDHLARRRMEKVKDGEVKYDFSEADAKVNEYTRQGRARAWYIVNIESKYRFEDGIEVGDGRKSAGKFLPHGPVSYRAYGDFLRALVKRVNGAVPGRKVELWSIDNEQASLYVPAFCSSGLTRERGEQAAGAYAEVLIYSARVIHEVDSQARIVFGGPGGGTPDEEYEYFYGPALRILASRIPGGGFDFFDFHNFNVHQDYRTNPRGKGLDFFRKILADAGLPGKPIIIKAGATHSGLDRNAENKRLHIFQTEAQQAEHLIKRFVYHVADGVPLILWGDIREDDVEHGAYSHNGLVYNGSPRSGRCESESENPCPDPGDGVRKLSYFALKHLIEKLKGSVWERTEAIPAGSDDVRIYKFLDTRNRPTWIAWYDYWKSGQSSRTVILEVGEAESALVTESLPRESEGAKIIPARYKDSFSRTTLPVADGKITISLGKSPVFVQPIDGSSESGIPGR